MFWGTICVWLSPVLPSPLAGRPFPSSPNIAHWPAEPVPLGEPSGQLGSVLSGLSIKFPGNLPHRWLGDLWMAPSLLRTSVWFLKCKLRALGFILL